MLQFPGKGSKFFFSLFLSVRPSQHKEHFWWIHYCDDSVLVFDFLLRSLQYLHIKDWWHTIHILSLIDIWSGRESSSRSSPTNAKYIDIYDWSAITFRIAKQNVRPVANITQKRLFTWRCYLLESVAQPTHTFLFIDVPKEHPKWITLNCSTQ